MKILFLPVYHYPEIAASLYLGENAREAYAAEGWEMKMFCPVPTRGVDDETRLKYICEPNTEELGGALKVERFRVGREGRNPFTRAIRYYICERRQFRRAKWEKNVDVLFISSTPPTHGLLMAKVKKHLGCKTVYNLQDIFPESLVSAGLTKKDSILWRIGRRIENKTYRNADHIVVISERFKRNIMAKGVPAEKISVVPNWVDENAVCPVERAENPLFDRFGLDKSNFYVTYCGNLGKSQNLSLLIDVATKTQSETDIKFVVIGDGVSRNKLAAQITERKLTNITLLPFLPYEEISNVFGLGDVGLVISKSGVGANSVPSKAWSIMCAERPILASFDRDSELGDVIEAADCGIRVEPDNADLLCEAIAKLKADAELCKKYGRNGREYVLENLTKEKGCGKLVEIMKSLS